MNNIIKNNIEFQYTRKMIKSINIGLLTQSCNLILKKINEIQVRYKIKTISILREDGAIKFKVNTDTGIQTICKIYQYEKKSKKYLIYLYNLPYTGSLLYSEVYYIK